MKNKQMKRLLCFLMVAAMLVQPVSVSAAPLESSTKIVDEENKGEAAIDEADSKQENEVIDSKEEITDEAAPEEKKETEVIDSKEEITDETDSEQEETADVEKAADEDADAEEGEIELTSLEDEIAALAVDPVLQSGTAVIPAGSDLNAVKLALAKALVENSEAFSEEELLALDWQYLCKGKTSVGIWGNESWGSIGGFTTQTKIGFITTKYTHPALADNGDGDYKVRLNGTEVTLTKKVKADPINSIIMVNEGVSVSLPYQEDGSVDYVELAGKIFDATVAGTTPSLGIGDVKMEYYAKAKSGSFAGIGEGWAPLGGGKVGLLDYPAIAAGNHQIRFSWSGDDAYTGTSAETTVTVKDREDAPYVLRDPVGSVKLFLKEDMSVDYEALKANLFGAIVAESEVLTADNVTVKYYGSHKVVGDLGKKWAALEGEDGYPAISAGTQKIQITWSGSREYLPATIEAEVEVTERENAPYVLRDPVGSVKLSLKEDMSVDYEALKANLFGAIVAESEVLTADNVTVKYYGSPVVSVGDFGKKWVALEGESGYPAVSAGMQKIQITWPGSREYLPTAIEAEVEVTERENAPYALRDPVGSVKLPINSDLSVNYGMLKGSVFEAVVAESEVLTADNVTVEYYATAKSGSLGSVGKAWMPLEGGKDSLLEYPGIPAGTQKIRISWPGSVVYMPTVIEADVEVLDREQVQFVLKDAPYEVGIAFADVQNYDYAATAKAIYEAVVASVTPEVSYEDMKVEYNTDLTGITDSYKSLDKTDMTGLVKFKDGEWKIRISCGDTVEYRGNSVTVKVTVSDNRIASAVVLKEGASFTYNMNPDVMRQAIFDSVIDWENSTLPAKETLSLDDFEIKYKAQMDVLDDSVDIGAMGGLISKIPGLEGVGGGIENIAGSLGENTKQWMPLEGGKYMGVSYVPMGAGQHQVQITYKGNAEYRPSAAAEGAVTVNKANVKVKVNSASIYADQPLPEGFITTDPADKFDFYTIYAGATSNVNLALYLDLPDKFTNNKLIRIIDPIVKKLEGRSFSEMLQDGVTLGELRRIFGNTELVTLLEKVGVDTGALGQMIKALGAVPSIADGVRISFGVPNRAGLYSVVAISDNKNYNTGVGVGTLLLRMRLSGVKLTWNQNLGSSIKAADAKNFDFKATLSYDGDVSVRQDNVHYLYSGFTSKWRVYSSTTTPPTEPGRYVMTVVTLGGNYQAAPITRSFQITK